LKIVPKPKIPVKLFNGLFFIFLLSSFGLKAQNYPIYNGYFLNPFSYNPAAAATERIQANAAYRKQWIEIPGSPTILNLSVSTLLNERRAGIGFRASSFNRGFLSSSEVSLAYAYGVPLDKTSRLYFGLSGGFLSNSLNTKDIASTDPALANVASSFTPSASFGMYYKNTNGLNLGLVLPKLISNNSLDANFTFSYFDNVIVTASFSRWDPNPKVIKKGQEKLFVKKKKKTNLPLEAFAIYRYSSIGGLFEATAKYNFNANIWLSGTYRQYAGIIPGIGLHTKDLSFGYFYETGVGGDLPLKTHEIMLSMQFGKEKKFRDQKPAPPVSKIRTNPVRVAAKKPTQKIDTSANHQARFKKEPPKTVAEAPKTNPTKPVVEKPAVTTPPANQPASTNTVQPTKTPATTPPVSAEVHAEERKQLDQHLDDHTDGKHDDTHEHPVNQRHDFVKKGNHHEELELATYVIAGAFQSRANAEHYVAKLKALGYEADFGHLSARNLWYVFVAEETEIPVARQERDELQKNKIFKDVWLLTVQE
jgi:type IX secretion system PorP/SprF family membrane protein